jgi:hypothetical protein
MRKIRQVAKVAFYRHDSTCPGGFFAKTSPSALWLKTGCTVESLVLVGLMWAGWHPATDWQSACASFHPL